MQELRDYVERIVYLSNNTDLMSDEQAQSFPKTKIVQKLRDCHKKLIARCEQEHDNNTQLLLMHSATDIAHCSLITEDDRLVKKNDEVLDQAFMQLGVFDNKLDSGVSETLLITLVNEQTKNWGDAELSSLVEGFATKWLADAPDHGDWQSLTDEELKLRLLLLDELFPEKYDELRSWFPKVLENLYQ